MYYFNSKKVYDSCSETLFIGKKIVYLPSCHSTNDIAAELIQNGNVMEGIVVITDKQTSGRGQRGNYWLTEAGQNLTFSLILKPTFIDISNQFILSQVAALGVVEGLRKFATGVLLKWPNDIYLHNKKIGGILIENSVQGRKIVCSVIGIGLNVNQLNFNSDRISSLGAQIGHSFDLKELLNEILQSIEGFYVKIRQGQMEQIRNNYLSYLLGYQEVRHFYNQSGRFSGTVIGVRNSGQIEIQLGNNEIQLFDLKEIEWVFD